MSVTRPATILVLEGNAAVEELVEQALRECGHRVLSTQNSLEALQVVRRVRIDVLVAGALLEARQSIVAELRAIQPEIGVVSICDRDDDLDESNVATRMSAPLSLDDLCAAVAAGSDPR